MYKFFPDNNTWSPKHIGPLAAITFIFLMIFNQSRFKIPYFEWALGGAVFLIMVTYFLVREYIPKKEFTIILNPLIWMFYALLCTPFVIDMKLHLSTIFLVSTLNLLTTFVIICVFSRSKLTSNVIITLSILWTSVNFIVWLAWISGYFSFEEGAFAGIFENRNQFAVQSVLLLSMLLYFVQDHKKLKLLICISSGFLILSSLSIKGFVGLFFVLLFPQFLKAKPLNKVITLIFGILLLVIFFKTLPHTQERIGRFVLIFSDPTSLRTNESAFLRTWLILEGLNVIKNHPLTGIGVDNSSLVLIPPYVLAKHQDTGSYSHNNYIEMLLNSGIIGFLLHYGPLLFVLFRIRNTHKYYYPLVTYVILYLLLGLGMVQYNNYPTIVLYCLTIFLYFYNDGVTEINEENTLYNKYS